MRNQSERPSASSVWIDIDIEAEPEVGPSSPATVTSKITDERAATQLFLRAVKAEPTATEPVGARAARVFRVPVARGGIEDPRAERVLCDAAPLADEAARHEHRRHVLAPLAMLLALSMLFAAGWSC